MPELSVISPVWGETYLRWLPEFLDSVLAQRGEVDLEVVIVDNANDPPLEIEREGVRVIRLDERVSVGEARNAAIATCDAPFIACGDVDDVFPPGYFARRRQVMCSRRRPVAYSTRPYRWYPDEDGRLEVPPYPQPHVFWLYRFRRIFGVTAIFGRSSFLMNGGVFRREAIMRAGGYSALNSEEDAQLSKFLPFFGPVVISPDGGSWKRQHEDSLVGLARRMPVEEKERTYAIAVRRYTSPPMPWWVRVLMKPLIVRHYARRLERYRREHPAAAG